MRYAVVNSLRDVLSSIRGLRYLFERCLAKVEDFLQENGMTCLDLKYAYTSKAEAAEGAGDEVAEMWEQLQVRMVQQY